MNNKKLCLVIVGYLEKYPPVLSFIQAVKDLGYDLTVFAAGDNSNIENYPGYDFAGIKYRDVIGEYSSDISLPAKLLRLMKIRKALWKNLSSGEYADATLVVVSEITVKHLGMKLIERDYILYQLELIEGFQIIPHSKLLKLDEHKIGNSAKAVVVCEYNRAHITKTWWRLDKLPYVIKNKPYAPYVDFENLPDNVANTIGEIKEKANDRKIILYQGIITKQRPVDKFIKAVEEKPEEYLFVVMSNQDPSFEDGVKPANYMYVPFIAPPYHLAVTSLAYIGVLAYVSTGKSSYSSLNPVYCAPNKIWEYAKFGVPMIANDNPALEYEFNNSGIGCCIRRMEAPDILGSIAVIDANYSKFSDNAAAFYEDYDTKKEIETVLNRVAK